LSHVLTHTHLGMYLRHEMRDEDWSWAGNSGRPRPGSIPATRRANVGPIRRLADVPDCFLALEIGHKGVDGENGGMGNAIHSESQVRRRYRGARGYVLGKLLEKHSGKVEDHPQRDRR
jgi:hypothetical protein